MTLTMKVIKHKLHLCASASFAAFSAAAFRSSSVLPTFLRFRSLAAADFCPLPPPIVGDSFTEAFCRKMTTVGFSSGNRRMFVLQYELLDCRTKVGPHIVSYSFIVERCRGSHEKSVEKFEDVSLIMEETIQKQEVCSSSESNTRPFLEVTPQQPASSPKRCQVQTYEPPPLFNTST